MILNVNHVSCGYGRRVILSDVSFSVDEGHILCMLGPNGVGKTTLFKTVLGLLPIQSGEICIEGRSVGTLSVREIAQRVAYVPQYHTPPFPYTVREVVSTGRTAYISRFSSPGAHDMEIVDSVLDMLDVSYLADAVYTEISGGERQMILIARALAQEPKLMILDEPTSNLDFGNQIKVLEVIKRLSRQGLSIVMTTHYPNHAFICDADVLLLQREKDIQIGSSEQIVTEENIQSAYGICSRIVTVRDNKGAHVKACVPFADI